MGQAARDVGVHVGYGTPAGSADVMMALNVPSLAFFFASPNPNIPKDRDGNWRLSRDALLLDAVGIVPMKDCFWTTAVEPNYQYPGVVWHEFQLHVIVAVLSNGPVWVGDAVGSLNMTALQPAMMADGTLLRPLSPCTALDYMFSAQWDGGEACLTSSGPTAMPATHIVLIADTSSSVTVSLADLLDDGSARYAAIQWGHSIKVPITVALNASGDFVVPALREAGANMSDYNRSIAWQLWTLAPVLAYDWLILGEQGKFVAVSDQRIVSVHPNSDTLEFEVVAAAESAETVLFSIGRLSVDDVMIAQCNMPVGTRSTVVCRAVDGCTCKQSAEALLVKF